MAETLGEPVTEDEKSSKRLTDLHKECMEAYQVHEEAWAENRRQALEDIKFRAGDHWPEEIKRIRSKIRAGFFRFS